MSTLKFNTLIVTPDVEAKLWSKHNRLTQFDVEEALDHLLDGPRWHVSPKHGGRVIAIGRCSAVGVIYMVFRPIDMDQGEWALVTAFESNENYLSKGDE